MPASYSDYKKIFDGLPMPFAFVDLDSLEANAKAILKRAGQKKIRLATKSIRCRFILEHIAQLSPQFQGLMTYHGQEAAWLAQQGWDDLLMGYPIWQASDAEAISQQVAMGKTVVCMVDSIAHVQHLNQIGEQHKTILPVCLDVDMSTDFPGLHFGVYRSPITTVDQALAVWKEIEQLPYVHLDSLMGYEAQIAGVADRMPGNGLQNAIVRWLKGLSAKKLAARRATVVTALQQAGAKLRLVNGGGTGSLEWTIQEQAVTEVTVGSGFYQSHLFDHYSNFRHDAAAGYAVQVVRSPKDGVFTAHGGGYTASGTPGKEKQPLPWLPQGMRLFPNEGVGEVQTPFRYAGNESLQPGDPVFFRHAKAGELCERFNSLWIVKGGKRIKEVPTYRGEGMNFG